MTESYVPKRGFSQPTQPQFRISDAERSPHPRSREGYGTRGCMDVRSAVPRGKGGMTRVGRLYQQILSVVLFGWLMVPSSSEVSPRLLAPHSTMADTTKPGLLSLEDHFVSSICQQDEIASTLSLDVFPKLILDKLLDVGPKRLDDMKSSNICLQVVSHIPVALGVDACKHTNDQHYDAVKEYHPCFAGFATLPMAKPESIVDELERCVKNLNFVGALTPNSAHGRYYDGPEYLAMWQAAEQLDVPIYLHPCPPSEQAKPKFRGNYSGDVAFAIGTHAWDWHSDCGAHFIRLFASGLFDRFPKLKIVLGHMGEMLPFMLGRIERKLALTKDSSTWRSTFRQVYARNVWVTTNGLTISKSSSLYWQPRRLEESCSEWTTPLKVRKLQRGL